MVIIKLLCMALGVATNHKKRNEEKKIEGNRDHRICMYLHTNGFASLYVNLSEWSQNIQNMVERSHITLTIILRKEHHFKCSELANYSSWHYNTYYPITSPARPQFIAASLFSTSMVQQRFWGSSLKQADTMDKERKKINNEEAVSFLFFVHRFDFSPCRLLSACKIPERKYKV